jgi:hypothetical protein
VDGNGRAPHRENRGEEMSMDVPRELLDRFARTIDLPAFAWQQGFRLSADQDPRALLMEHPRTGEALLLERDVDRGWRYRVPDDPEQRGSTIDFLARREGATPAECLERLAACAEGSGNPRSQEAARYRAVLREKPEALERARNSHEALMREELAATRMLERLGVPRAALDEQRFGAVKREADVAALMREPETLWASRHWRLDKAVVLVERPIDAIAHDRAIGRHAACYIATGAGLDDERRNRLARVLAEVPAGIGVVLAFGRDQSGRALADEVQRLAPQVRMERHAPQLGARWADQMQLEQRHAMSLRRENTGPAL